jgi:hypothetical protein
MKNSKTIFICAVVLIAAELAKIFVSIGGIYNVYPGWVDSFALDVAAIWVVCKSEVKRKGMLALCGVLLLLFAAVIIAALSTFGFVEITEGGAL